MSIDDGERRSVFELVNIAHHFLIAAIPLRHIQSAEALSRFVDRAKQISVRSGDRRSVLLHTLAVLQPHTGGRLPSLTDQFLAARSDSRDDWTCFELCVQSMLAHRGVGDPHVQGAINLILEGYDSRLSQADVAAAVGLTPSALCHAFRARTGFRFVEYLREVRLSRAAAMLARPGVRVKEVWASVGYSDAASFTHHFRARFGRTPTEFMAGAAQQAEKVALVSQSDKCICAGTSKRVLVTDDDACTRMTLSQALKYGGYLCETAATAAEALRSVRGTEPDLIVLDVHLPDRNGLDCLRDLRAGGYRNEAMLLTADWDFEDFATQAHALKAIVMSKLADLEEVERVIRSLCSLSGRSISRN